MYGDDTIAFRAMEALGGNGVTASDRRRLLMSVAQVYHAASAKKVLDLPVNRTKLREALKETGGAMTPKEFRFVARGFDYMRRCMKKKKRHQHAIAMSAKEIRRRAELCGDDVIRACACVLLPEDSQRYSRRLPLVMSGLWELLGVHPPLLLRGTLAIVAADVVSSDHPHANILARVVRERCPQWIATTNPALQVGVKEACREIGGMANGTVALGSLWEAFRKTMDVLLPVACTRMDPDV